MLDYFLDIEHLELPTFIFIRFQTEPSSGEDEGGFLKKSL